MPAPPIVQKLIQRFDDHSDHYRSAEYKEDQLRQEFINPLFESLGWDMANTEGHAPQYRDVIHEDALKIGKETKAPDYAFCIAGLRKFFLEAKKPAVGIKKSAESAYQLRRYAWSATLPVSILTNFAEFAIYDCRKKPGYQDKASHGRVDYFTHHDLIEKWDEFAGIFSKSAILNGSFDKYAESTKGKRGTATVDGAFLAEIEGWRSELAKNLALRNASLDNRSLNFAVQVIIDRIIFLRMCEDRGIEPYGQLQGFLKRPDIYESLVRLFNRADERYNSGLFHFESETGREEPDSLTPNLTLDDKVLKDIIGGLYYPECPYEFSALPADILGQVYEQFLGKVIRLTASHHAKVEDKPEVKKAGGVYYTPSYIVQYIVERTVGKLLEGSTPKDAAKLHILDPACGSGSFLLGAFQHLIDWHLKSKVLMNRWNGRIERTQVSKTLACVSGSHALFLAS
ncbi:MAG: type I restriction endonuclease [Gemmataceae bacterium]